MASQRRRRTRARSPRMLPRRFARTFWDRRKRKQRLKQLQKRKLWRRKLLPELRACDPPLLRRRLVPRLVLRWSRNLRRLPSRQAPLQLRLRLRLSRALLFLRYPLLLLQRPLLQLLRRSLRSRPCRLPLGRRQLFRRRLQRPLRRHRRQSLRRLYRCDLPHRRDSQRRCPSRLGQLCLLQRGL
jgi:hypothetical protein